MRRWRRKVQVDAGERPGATSSGHAEIRRPKREVVELCRPKKILKSASAFSQRSSTALRRMIAYIDAHRGQFGVELICAVLRAATPGFFTFRSYRARAAALLRIGKSATSSWST